MPFFWGSSSQGADVEAVKPAPPAQVEAVKAISRDRPCQAHVGAGGEPIDVSIGIDLGTTYCCVAAVIGGEVEIIQDNDGMKIFPSYVGFDEEGRVVGHLAKQEAEENLQNTVFDAKRLIGRKFSDRSVQEDLAHFPFKVQAVGDKPMIVVREEGEQKQFAPEEISAMVLRSLKETTMRYFAARKLNLSQPIKAVITVPAYFNDQQRSLTRQAGEAAGLEVVRIINEPTAAALAYGLDVAPDPKNPNRKVLIFDLGGGTFDVSLLSVRKNIFDVLATNGDVHLGGEDFDSNTVAYFVQQIKANHSVDLSKNAQKLAELRTACRNAKCALSYEEAAEVVVEKLLDRGRGAFRAELTRAEFEKINRVAFERCLAPVKQVLKDAYMSASEVDEVVLVGGSTRIPFVIGMLAKHFKKAPNNQIHPDESVAHGAAIQAAILNDGVDNSSQMKGVVLRDVIPMTLGIETDGGDMDVIVHRNTHLPVREKKYYRITDDEGRGSIDLKVLQGEKAMASDNTLLDQFNFTLPEGDVETMELRVEYQVDLDGIFNMTATEMNSGQEVQAVVKNKLLTNS